jgi:hypothetical protein
MNAVLVTVAFLRRRQSPPWAPKWIHGKSSYSLMVYYRPNCATTTSHANHASPHFRPHPSREILAAANAVILGKSRKPASHSAACWQKATC